MIQRKRLLFQKCFIVVWFIWVLTDLVVILSDFQVGAYYNAIRPFMFIMFMAVMIMPVNDETKLEFRLFLKGFITKLLPFSSKGNK